MENVERKKLVWLSRYSQEFLSDRWTSEPIHLVHEFSFSTSTLVPWQLPTLQIFITQWYLALRTFSLSIAIFCLFTWSMRPWYFWLDIYTPVWSRADVSSLERVLISCSYSCNQARVNDQLENDLLCKFHDNTAMKVLMCRWMIRHDPGVKGSP